MARFGFEIALRAASGQRQSGAKGEKAMGTHWGDTPD